MGTTVLAIVWVEGQSSKKRAKLMIVSGALVASGKEPKAIPFDENDRDLCSQERKHRRSMMDKLWE
jgi:hypothetical protein